MSKASKISVSSIILLKLKLKQVGLEAAKKRNSQPSIKLDNMFNHIIEREKHPVVSWCQLKK